MLVIIFALFVVCLAVGIVAGHKNKFESDSTDIPVQPIIDTMLLEKIDYSGRIDFLKRYTLQLDSDYRLGKIEKSEYEQERNYISVELDKIEKEFSFQ